MKNLKILLSALLFIAITTSCTYAHEKAFTNKAYPIQSFTSIKSKVVGNIVYTQSSKVSVKAEGDNEMINSLRISESEGILTIVHPTKFSKRRKGDLTIYISSPNIELFEVNGVGNWSMKGNVKTNHLKIGIEGVGNFKALELECNNLKANSEGVGNLMLGGITEFVEIQSEGVGSVNAEKLISKNTVVSSYGVGSVKCYASESIDVHNSGVGSVTYYGNPTVKSIKNSGVGKTKAGE